jgi:kojibiose phosphorylase
VNAMSSANSTALTPAGVDSPGPWTIDETEWDPARANYFETILSVGNGRLGTRGTLEEGHHGQVSGTYLAGVYDAHDSQVIDLVNAPDWLDTEVYVDGARLDPDSATVTEHRRTLDLRTGVLTRDTVFTLDGGDRVRLRSTRTASVADRDLCLLRLTVTVLDSPATVTVVTGLDAHRRNMEALPVYPAGTVFGPDRKWEKWARSTHLRGLGRGFTDAAGWVESETIDSRVTIAYAMTVAPAPSSPPPVRTERRARHERVIETVEFDARPDAAVGIDKAVGIATSRDYRADGRSPRERALATATGVDFDAALAASARVWAELWVNSDLRVIGDERATLAMRFSIYHLLITANPDDPTVNIGAKSLSGEGYRGHVFWDTEIMMLPFFLFTQPHTARALLGYRHHTLAGARQVAADGGNIGARYPWESADTGLEECPITTPDGQNRFYTRDEELHVTADVAYAIARYREITGDDSQLREEGAEILFDTARFWLSRAESDGEHLHLRTVMGPDEFHSHVDDNAFTNRMVRWHLEYAVAVYDELAREHPDELAGILAGLDMTSADRDAWAAAADALISPNDPDGGLIEQFDGYFERLEVPITEWDGNDMPRYPAGRNHFNCEDTTLLKQPDVVMLMFLLPDEYSLDTRRINFEFYEQRTLHKSSLSPSIHAIVGLQVGDPTMAERYFARSAFVDLDDNQGNTEEGMHIASAGGTWQIAVHGFGGMLATAEGLRFNPELPTGWQRLRFTVQWRGRAVEVDLGHDEHRFRLIGSGAPERITVSGRAVDLPADTTVTVPAEATAQVTAGTTVTTR